MVNELPPPMLIADAAGLDFLNSLATPAAVPMEWLGSGEDFLSWLDNAGLVPRTVLEEFKRNAGPGELDAIAAQARSLREWFRVFVLAHMGKPIDKSTLAELEPLNRLLTRDECFFQLATDETMNERLLLKKERRWRSPETLLLPVAEAMAHLVCDVDFTHVKQCESHTCSLLFLDRTKGHARRWCSMAICGNRAKQAAHRSRNQV